MQKAKTDIKTSVLKKNNQKKAKSNISFDIIAAGIALGLLLLSLTFYFVLKINKSDKQLIPLGTLFLIGGLLYEYKKICEKWTYALITTVASFVLSFFAFLPDKHEKHYVLEDHITSWPYMFCFFFILIAIILYKDKITPNLTEGITLLQSIAIIYWVIDEGLFSASNTFLNILMFFGLIYSFVAIFNAFSYSELSRRTRLNLSIWSSFIMAFFAIGNIYVTYQNAAIEFSKTIYEAIYISAQYFLLGVSAMYVAQNIFMLIGFIPGRGSFFNKRYFRDVKELKDDHIKRYSTEQVKKTDAFLCVFFSSTIFALNYHFQFLPRNFAIWVVFFTFPILLHQLSKRQKHNR